MADDSGIPVTPIFVNPVDPQTGKFVYAWTRWFDSIYQNVQTLIGQHAITVQGTDGQIIATTTNSNAVLSLPTNLILGTLTPRVPGSLSLIANDGTKSTISAGLPGNDIALTLPSQSGTLALAGTTGAEVFIGRFAGAIDGLSNSYTFSSSNFVFGTYNTYKLRWYNVGFSVTSDKFSIIVNGNSTGQYTSFIGTTSFVASHGWYIQNTNSANITTSGYMEITNTQSTSSSALMSYGISVSGASPGGTSALVAPTLIAGTNNTFGGPVTSISVVTISSALGAGSNFTSCVLDLYGITA